MNAGDPDHDPTLDAGHQESEPLDGTLVEPHTEQAEPAVEWPRIPGITIDGVLGKGGQGTVYRGRQNLLDRPVAVKLIDVASTDAFVMRFQREAKILALIEHPHIVACYQADVTEAGHTYMVMEFIDGPDLYRWIKTKGTLEVVDALTIARDVAAALRHALEHYDAAVIHRDVKPHNVLLQPLRKTECPFPFRAKLADLGLACSTSDSTAFTQLTVSGAVMGTPATMAPEQFDDPDEVDFRADIYGLGCVLFHALVGRTPFSGRSMPQVFKQKTVGELPDPGMERGGLSDGVRRLILRMIDADREMRPQSYGELIEALEAEIDALGPACSTLADTVDVGAGSDDDGAQRRKLVRIAGGVLLIVALAIVGVVMRGGGDEEGAAPSRAKPATIPQTAMSQTGDRETTEPRASERADPGRVETEDPAPEPNDADSSVAPLRELALQESRNLALELAAGGSTDWGAWTGDTEVWTVPEGASLGAEVIEVDTDEGSGERAGIGLPAGHWELSGAATVSHKFYHSKEEPSESRVVVDFGGGRTLTLLLTLPPAGRNYVARWTWTVAGKDRSEGLATEVANSTSVFVPFRIRCSVDGKWTVEIDGGRPAPAGGLPGIQGPVDSAQLTLLARNAKARWKGLVVEGQ